MFNAKKGKEATKGQKQIIEDNRKTLQFYMIIIGLSSFVHILERYIFVSFDTNSKVLFFISLFIHGICFWIMKLQAGDTYGNVDLNTNSGLSENLKDAIILTSISQMLSLYSKWFWWLLVIIPLRASYIIWINILQPWFFAQPNNPEGEEKKQKKLERKMKKFK